MVWTQMAWSGPVKTLSQHLGCLGSPDVGRLPPGSGLLQKPRQMQILPQSLMQIIRDKDAKVPSTFIKGFQKHLEVHLSSQRGASQKRDIKSAPEQGLCMVSSVLYEGIPCGMIPPVAPPRGYMVLTGSFSRLLMLLGILDVGRVSYVASSMHHLFCLPILQLCV